MAAFEAKYRGKCAGCGGGIQPGDPVLFVNDELVHEDCEGRALRAARPVVVCPVCFLVKPCGCEDGQ